MTLTQTVTDLLRIVIGTEKTAPDEGIFIVAPNDDTIKIDPKDLPSDYEPVLYVPGPNGEVGIWRRKPSAEE